MKRAYKAPKKATVQLTSLLDLLFVMIFVSLLQQKAATQAPVKQPQKKPIAKAKPITKPKVKVVKPAPVKKPTKFNLTAIFNFHPTAQNPKVPEGTYRMSGSYDSKTGNLYLGGTGWINRPKHYDMVPLSGKIDQSSSMFTGRIEFQGCKQFNLRREFRSDNTPISGTWKGVYDCSQGQTGLTLTIE